MKKQKQPFAELDKSLDEFLQKRKEAAQEIKTAAKAGRIMTTMLGRLLSRILEGEMNDHLGYRRGESKVGDNERNGHTTKRLKTETLGDVSVEMPGDRQGRFLPSSVPKNKRRLDGFGEKILALYAPPGKSMPILPNSTSWTSVRASSATSPSRSFRSFDNGKTDL